MGVKMTKNQRRYYELRDDLKLTEEFFKKSNNPKVKEAINKLRIPIIVAYNELGIITRGLR